MSTDLGKISITLEGEYNASIVYSKLDMVTFNGSSYTSKKDNNTAPITDVTSWQLSAQKGDTGNVSTISFNINNDMDLIMELSTNSNLNFVIDSTGHLILIN
jgi:hypothetical protein